MESHVLPSGSPNNGDEEGIELSLEGVPFVHQQVRDPSLSAAVQGLEWKDRYFDHREDVLAVFDFNRAKLILDRVPLLVVLSSTTVGLEIGVNYATKGKPSILLSLVPVAAIFIMWLRTLQRVLGMHLAVTHTGVTYAVESLNVHGRRPIGSMATDDMEHTVSSSGSG